MRRTSVEGSEIAQAVPNPPSTGVPDGRGTRRRTSVRFVDSTVESEDPTSAGYGGSPAGRQRQRSSSLVLSETGAVIPAPRALQDVLDDGIARHLLTVHRAKILSALGTVAGPGSTLHPETFRITLLSLQLGFQPKQVDDLLETLLYLGRVGATHGNVPAATESDGTQLVCFSLLFHHSEAPATMQDAAPLPPGLVQVETEPVGSPVTTHDERGQKWAEAESWRAQRELAGSRFRLPSVTSIPDSDVAPELNDSDPDLVVATDSEEDEFEELSPELKATRLRALAKNRSQTAQRFRMPSVEELILDAAGSPGRMDKGRRHGADTQLHGPPGRRRETMPAVALMNNDGHIAGTLDAYSSIGMIAVFFASLSLTVLSAEDLEGASGLVTASICLMCVVLVLNIFTVLTMSMIYYYGQLHIGHGMSETAAYFIQRNRQLKNLRRWALEAFWASAPLFMIAMGLKFVGQDRDPSGSYSIGGMIIACIFGAGVVIVVVSTFTVLRAHRTEIEFWELAQQESGRASRRH